MSKHAAIILSRPYFAFLRDYLPDLKHVVYSDDLESLLDRKIILDGQGQKTADYIIGTHAYPGILREYFKRGYKLDIIEELFFLKHGRDHFQRYDLLDMQFSAIVPAELMQILESHGKRVIGWSPPELGGKAAQAALLSRHARTSTFIPQQVIFINREQLTAAQQQSMPPDLQAEYWIAKPIYASRSRMPDGSDYRVFHKSLWPQFRKLALMQKEWFANRNGLLVAELVETRDPFLDNHNAVLHKVHIPGGLPGDILDQWPLQCRKLPVQCNLSLLRDTICNLGDVLQSKPWEPGHLEDYRSDLKALAGVLPERPCLYSVDLMIRPDGRLVFLECNKLAGTFIERIYGDQCPLGLYMETLARLGLL